MFGKKKVMWNDIVNAYINSPRDVKTIPMNKEGQWFYVYVEDDNIYIECALNHSNSCIISNRRKLEKEKLDAMLSLYHRRKKGEAVSKEATQTTQNQVYWYGIFSDMNL